MSTSFFVIMLASFKNVLTFLQTFELVLDLRIDLSKSNITGLKLDSRVLNCFFFCSLTACEKQTSSVYLLWCSSRENFFGIFYRRLRGGWMV